MTTRVRPITVMAAAAVVALMLVGVFALTRDDTNVVGQPATIPVDLGAQAEASVTTMSGTPTYERGPDLDEPADTQTAWVISTASPEPAAVRRLADALGVSGDLRQVDGMWQVGADDGAHVKVQVSAGLAWDYTAGGIPAVAAACAEPEITPTAPPTTNASDLPADAVPTTTIAASGSTDDGGCLSTPPPQGVPSAAEAEEATRDLVRRAGMDVAQMRVTATGDEWGARATASPELGDTATRGIDTIVVFGADAAITHASGVLGTATRADTYPLVRIDAAIARLNAGRDVLDGYPLVPVPASDGAVTSDDAVVASDATYGPASTAGSTVTTFPVTTVPDPDATMPCAVPPSGDEQVTTTTIKSAGDGDAGGSSSGPTGCSGEVSPCAPCPSDAVCVDGCSDPTCDPATCADPHPGPTVVPDPSGLPPSPDVPTATTVTLTSVEVVLAALPGTDGAIWLVPAYRFGTVDPATYTVLAIDESFLSPASSPAPEPATDPTAVDTSGTMQTVPPDAPDVPSDPCCPPTLQADGSVAPCTMTCSPGSSATVTTSGG